LRLQFWLRLQHKSFGLYGKKSEIYIKFWIFSKYGPIDLGWSWSQNWSHIMLVQFRHGKMLRLGSPKNLKLDVFGRGSSSGSHKAPPPPFKMRQLQGCNIGLHGINQFSNRFYLNRGILTYFCKILISYSIRCTVLHTAGGKAVSPYIRG
jgi:hypothetical protein